MPELTVVMPVYNEEEIIDVVVLDWVQTLRSMNIDFTIDLYNDGSKDNSLEILMCMKKQYSEVKVIDKPNSGHGPTILQGYKKALSSWIFQIDSDNEMEAKFFHKLWNKRDDYDFLVGKRENRAQPLSRKIVSALSRFTVRFLYSSGIYDVNSPYRLMRQEKFIEIFHKIPKNTFAPNIIISGMVAQSDLRLYETKIPIKFRTTGEASIKKWKLFRAAVTSWWQTLKASIF
ncbi:MAG: glycosyltransferase family 2 protein [archaeon]|nr:glycosyltransferase family 2 protein [archaeon]